MKSVNRICLAVLCVLCITSCNSSQNESFSFLITKIDIVEEFNTAIYDNQCNSIIVLHRNINSDVLATFTVIDSEYELNSYNVPLSEFLKKEMKTEYPKYSLPLLVDNVRIWKINKDLVFRIRHYDYVWQPVVIRDYDWQNPIFIEGSNMIRYKQDTRKTNYFIGSGTTKFKSILHTVFIKDHKSLNKPYEYYLSSKITGKAVLTTYGRTEEEIMILHDKDFNSPIISHYSKEKERIVSQFKIPYKITDREDFKKNIMLSSPDRTKLALFHKEKGLHIIDVIQEKIVLHVLLKDDFYPYQLLDWSIDSKKILLRAESELFVVDLINNSEKSE